MCELIERERCSDSPSNEQLISLLRDLANIYSERHRPDLAEPVLREVVQLARAVPAAQSPELAVDLVNHGRMLLGLGNLTEAEPLLREALEIRRHACGEESPEFAWSLESLAEVLSSIGRHAQAEEHGRRAREILARAEKAPPSLLIRATITQAQALRHLGRHEEAEVLLDEALDDSRQAAGQLYVTTVPRVHRELGLVYEATGRLKEAVQEHLDALSAFRETFGKEPQGYLELLEAPIEPLQLLGRHRESLPLMREVIERIEGSGADEARLCPWLVRLGMACVETGAIEEAEGHLLRGLETAGSTLGRASYEYVNASTFLMHVYTVTDRWVDAERQARAALDGIEQLAPPDDEPVLTIMASLAAILDVLGHAEDSQAVVREIVTRTCASSDEDVGRFLDLLDSMAKSCFEREQYPNALTLLLRVQEIQQQVLSTDDPKRNEVDCAVAWLRSRLGQDLPEGFQRVHDPGPEDREMVLFEKCINAYLRQDYELVLQHADRFDFQNIRTALLALLSLVHLGRSQLADGLAEGMEKGLSGRGFEQMLVQCVLGTASVAEASERAGNPSEQCMAYYFAGERLLSDGEEDRGRKMMVRAVECAQRVDGGLVEGAMAQQRIALLDQPPDVPAPVDIYMRLREIDEEMRGALEEGRDDEALALAKKARDVAMALGPRHPAYAQRLLNLADLYDEHGEHQRADELVAMALGILYKVFGPKHSAVSSAERQALIAGFSPKTTDRMVTRATSVVAATHSETALLLLVRGLQDMTHAGGHWELFERALEAVSEDPPQVAILRAGLGYLSPEEALKTCQTEAHRCQVHYVAGRHLLVTGDIEAARAHFDAAIALDGDSLLRHLAEKERPPESRPAPRSRSAHANAVHERIAESERLARAGQAREAGLLAQAAEQTWRETQDDGLDPETLARLGMVYLTAGWLKPAQANLERAITACGADEGQVDAWHSAASESLGAIHLARGGTTRAGEQLRAARDALRSAGAVKTPRYVRLLHRFSKLHLLEANGAAAERVARELVEVSRVVFGNEHQMFAAALDRLGQAMALNHRHEDALAEFERAHEIRSDVLGETNPATLASIFHLAATCAAAGFAERGNDYLDRCWDLVAAGGARGAATGRAGTPDGRGLLELAAWFYDLGQHERAEVLARRAMDYFTAEDAADSTGYCVAATRLADALQAQGRLPDALCVREQVVNKTADRHGKNSPEYGQSLNALALTVDAMGDEQRARELYEVSLSLIHGLGLERERTPS